MSDGDWGCRRNLDIVCSATMKMGNRDEGRLYAMHVDVPYTQNYKDTALFISGPMSNVAHRHMISTSPSSTLITPTTLSPTLTRPWAPINPACTPKYTFPSLLLVFANVTNGSSFFSPVP